MSRRVLVIDDEDDIRAIATIALERVGGWEVRVARAGAEGLTIAAAWRPDAILLDEMMPEMSGLATLAALRSEPSTRDIPVLFLTASVQTEQRRIFVDAGAVSVLAKPFDPMTLARDVATALGWSG